MKIDKKHAGICTIAYSLPWSGICQEGRVYLWLAERKCGTFKGRLEFPGGHQKKQDKEHWQTAYREFNEETGVEFISEPESFDDLGYVTGIKKAGQVYTTHGFGLALWPDQIPKQTEPEKRYTWRKFSLRQVLEMDPDTLMPCAPLLLLRLRWVLRNRLKDQRS